MHTPTGTCLTLYMYQNNLRINFFLYIAHYFHKRLLKADQPFYAEKNPTPKPVQLFI